ncbi:chorismate mutase [Verrucomicrobiota bacterium]
MSLDELRCEIDKIDEKLVSLLNQRAHCASEIGKKKNDADMPVHDRVREEEVLARVKSLNTGPVNDGNIESIYRQIISACLEVQNDKLSSDG